MAALARFEAGLAKLRDEMDKTHRDLMERLGRQQTRLDGMDEQLTTGRGYTDRVDRRSAALSEYMRLFGWTK